MRTLHLTLKKQWFLMIASGEKKEEYREIKSYWSCRLLKYFEDKFSICHNGKVIAWFESSDNPTFKQFDIVSANNGYAKDCPNIKWQHKGIRIGEGKPEWGAVPGVKYFILEIGEIIK